MFRVLFLSLVLVGCGGAVVAGPSEDELDVLTAPQALASDVADRNCRVILREAKRAPGPTGYESDCSSGKCYFVFTATVDVATSDAQSGSAVGVLYQAGSDPAWHSAFGDVVAGSPVGFQRFSVRLTQNTVEEGLSGTGMSRIKLQMAPFARLGDGSRLFDHNVLAGDLDSYVLSANNNFAVTESPAICPVSSGRRAVLRFGAGWQHGQQGTIAPGGKLTVHYDANRLPQCFGDTYMGQDAWDTLGFIRFQPGGELLRGSVKRSRPLEVTVPPVATSVELWFLTSGRHCAPTYDSNLGGNYRFEVTSAPAPVAWAGDIGGSFARDCMHRDGLADPIVIDGYVMQRACKFVDADVYVPGITDGNEVHPEKLFALVERSMDGAARDFTPVTFVGRVGNNYRYRWELPYGDLNHLTWSEWKFAFRFSTDGVFWYRAGTGVGAYGWPAGPTGGAARRIQRAF